MASTGQPSSLKRRDASVTRGGDQLTITPLGAGNEVGRSCVYMSYKGKTVLVCTFSKFCPSITSESNVSLPFLMDLKNFRLSFPV